MTSQDATPPRLARAAAPGDGVAVLDLAGELDLAISAELRELVDGVVSESPRLVVADVEAVGFMDSTILRELLRALRAVEDGGGRFVIAGAQPTVRRLLELTGTAELFALAESRAAAVSSTHG